MKYIFTICLLGHLTFLFAQDFMPDTCHLKGSIKSIKYDEKTYFTPGKVDTWETLNYTFNKQKRTIKVDRSIYFSFEDDTFYSSLERKFNASGILYSSETYRQDKNIISITDFFYDSTYLMIQSKYYHGNRETHINTAIYKYNDSKKLIESNCKTVDGDVFLKHFEYNNFGKMTYSADISSTNKQYRFWTYNDQNLLTEEKYLDSNWTSRTTFYMGNDNHVDSSKIEDFSNNVYTKDSYIYYFKHNETGQLIEKIETTANGKIVLKRTYSYNANGNPVQELVYLYESDRTDIYTYEYIYDKFTNWISKTTKFNGEVFKEEFHEIIYN